MSGIQLGCQVNAWQREFAVKENLGEALRQIKAIGFVGAEVGVAYIADLDHPEAVRELMAQHGLTYAAIHLGGLLYDRQVAREKAIPAFRRGAEFGKAAGAQSALVSTAAKRVEKQIVPLTPDEQDSTVEGLREVCRILADLGMPAYYHNHAYEFAHGGEVLDRILNGVDKSMLSLAFDTANAAAFLPASEVPATVRRYADRIGYVHYKDCRGPNIVESLGDGDIDFAAMARALKDARFSGWAVAEIEPPTGGPATRSVSEDVSRSFRLMRETLG